MIHKAFEWIEANNFDFIITDEVVSQRSMSQHKVIMPVIAGESGANDRFLRPLCAKNPPETLPNRQGLLPS